MLEPADIAEPLTYDQVSDADAILFTANAKNRGLSEVTAFAYYHRRQRAELIENPAIGAGPMLGELFDSLPEKIEDGLLDKLATEVNELKIADHKQPKGEQDSVDLVQTQAVSLQRPFPKPANENQYQLFDTEVTELYKKPSTEIIKAAEKFHNYRENLFGSFGHIATWMNRVEPRSKVAKVAFMIPAIVELALELPLIIAIDNTQGTLIRSRLAKAILAEYPHLSDEIYRTSSRLPSSIKLEKYAEVVLGVD